MAPTCQFTPTFTFRSHVPYAVNPCRSCAWCRWFIRMLRAVPPRIAVVLLVRCSLIPCLMRLGRRDRLVVAVALGGWVAGAGREAQSLARRVQDRCGLDPADRSVRRRSRPCRTPSRSLSIDQSAKTIPGRRPAPPAHHQQIPTAVTRRSEIRAGPVAAVVVAPLEIAELVATLVGSLDFGRSRGCLASSTRG